MKRTVCWSFIAVSVLFTINVLSSSNTEQPKPFSLEKAAPLLSNYLSESTELPEKIPVFIIMDEQYDSQKLYDRVKYLPKDQRRKETVETLKSFSEKTQASVRETLNMLEKEGQIGRLRYLWISNVIGLEATYQALQLIDKHPDVGLIEYDPPQRFLPEDPEETKNRRLNDRDDGSGQKTREITYNVLNVHAPDVWDLGYNGEGVLVAVIDSGVNYNHTDIRNQMWIHPDFPNHGYNFWEDNLDPMDYEGHGTHCAGTVAGDGTSGSETGMAPGATIMALKPLHGFTGQHQTFWHAVQFAVEYEADILSVSMYWRHTLLDNITRATFRTIMVNILSAGVVMCKSAGNDGTAMGQFPIPYNVNIPAGSPPPWLNPDQTVRSGLSCVISVGATDINNNIASWSSRGPVTWQGVPGWNDYPYNPGPGLLKPDIVAPGLAVKSLIHSNNTGYTHKSGTSMAAPGVAGVLALMMSKNPYLTPERISQIIEETATPYTETKSNTYGAGLIHALRAVQASSMIGLTEVTVSDDNLPEYGETVDLNITLINIGEEDVEELSATLSTDDEYIEIINNFAQFDGIEVDSTETINNAFTIAIAGNTPHLHRANFRLGIVSDDERTWNNKFFLDIQAPLLVIDTVRVTGADIDIPQFGETVSLAVDIKNSGGSQARQLTSVLSTADEYITIIENNSAYPDIDIQESESNTDLFVIRIGDNTPHNHKAELTLTIQGAGGQRWIRDFHIPIQAPELAISSPFVYDPPPGGNNDGIVNPGEILTIYLPLTNTGGTGTPPISLEVTIDNEFIEIIDLTDNHITSMEPGETVYPAIIADISMLTPQGTILSFDYSITSGEYLFENCFILGVGGEINIRVGAGDEVNDPISPNPINIYYRTLRSQTIYTAEEIRNSGMATGGLITGLGYYVFETPVHILPDWMVRMRHTNASNGLRHIDGPYETVYSSEEYVPQAGGWDMLTLDTPFEWNGVDNILVDTAFSPTLGWSSSGRTLIYEVPNGFRFGRRDTPAHHDSETNTVNSDKPQIMFSFNTTPGTEFSRPSDLRVSHPEDGVLLQWTSPGDNRSTERLRASNPVNDKNQRRDSRGTPASARTNQPRTNQPRTNQPRTRNPSFNVYRNGLKINTEPIEDTEFLDTDGLSEVEQFYYVTAVYDEAESLPSNIVSAGIVANIVVTPSQGVYYEPVNAAVISPTPNTTIFYTTDGSDPDEGSSIYQQPINIPYYTVLKSIAVRENWKPSETSTVTYHILHPPEELTANVQPNVVTLSWEDPWQPARMQDDTDLPCRIESMKNEYNGNRGVIPQGEPPRHDKNLRLSGRRDTDSERASSRTDNIGNNRQTRSASIQRTTLRDREYLQGYNLYRAAEEDSFFVINDEPITSNSYRDVDLPINDYRYYVTAVYEVGESKPSNIISINSGETYTEENILPVYTTKLYNAYPNPFNPSTTISFSLKDADRVSLEVYNIAGKKVVTILGEHLEPGRYEIIWDGTNESGSRVGSGIYLYRLSTSDYTEVKKAVMLK